MVLFKFIVFKHYVILDWGGVTSVYKIPLGKARTVKNFELMPLGTQLLYRLPPLGFQ